MKYCKICFDKKFHIYYCELLTKERVSCIIQSVVKKIALHEKLWDLWRSYGERGLVLRMAKDLKISFLLDFYGDMLTDKQREVIDAYYNEDLSLAEIAGDRDITRQGVRDAIKRAEQQMLEMEERLGLAHRFQEMQEALAGICDYALSIQDINGQNGNIPEIDQCVAGILERAQEIAINQ